MFKNIVSPVQAWLLSQGRCVGCGMPLSKASHEKYDEGLEKITCKCHRVFIYETESKKYRRALIKEV